MFKENLPKKESLVREFLTQKHTHMGGTYRYPQHAVLPLPRVPKVLIAQDTVYRSECHVPSY